MAVYQSVIWKCRLGGVFRVKKHRSRLYDYLRPAAYEDLRGARGQELDRMMESKGYEKVIRHSGISYRRERYGNVPSPSESEVLRGVKARCGDSSKPYTVSSSRDGLGVEVND